MKFRYSGVFWGIFLLLAAVFIIANPLKGIIVLGTGSLILAILSAAMIVHCIVFMHVATLPIPLAILYIVFHDVFQRHFGWPYPGTWKLIAAAVLATIALGILFPGLRRFNYYSNRRQDRLVRRQRRGRADTADAGTANTSNDNNPSVSVNFGAVSRHLRADSLETARLDYHFGAIEVFFDEVTLNPNGAEAIVNCSFGAISIFLPKHWRLAEKMNCSLGGIDIDKYAAAPAENAPVLTLTGSVSLGGIEIRYI